MAGRLVVVVCSLRVPLGLLPWPAWHALQTGPVLTAEPDHPQLPALNEAGVHVTTATEDLRRERVAAGQDVVWFTAQRQSGAAEVIEVEDPPGARLAEAVAVMDRLRSPGGCPWDAQQTHTSLMPYLLEETYEAYQALEDGDLVDLREELGDVLLQVLFHSRLAQEQNEPWSVDDVAGDLVDKLVRRHPHVFAGASADDLEGSWEALKQAEKGRVSVTDGVP
ncbi:MAG: MazG family protein, partial [Frankiales bacterium]|nr:MazG family protein [Frankiales bacterium]